LQRRDHSFRYSLSFPPVAVMALHRNVRQEDDILCELYADTRSDVSDYSDNESLDSDIDAPRTSSRKQLWSSADPKTPQFPHPFFLTSIKMCMISSDIARQKRKSLRCYEGWQLHSTWPRTGSQALEKREVSVPEEWWQNGGSVEPLLKSESDYSSSLRICVKVKLGNTSKKPLVATHSYSLTCPSHSFGDYGSGVACLKIAWVHYPSQRGLPRGV
jgi:hypothetical protein